MEVEVLHHQIGSFQRNRKFEFQFGLRHAELNLPDALPQMGICHGAHRGQVHSGFVDVGKLGCSTALAELSASAVVACFTLDAVLPPSAVHSKRSFATDRTGTSEPPHGSLAGSPPGDESGRTGRGEPATARPAEPDLFPRG
eukprot:445638_1